MASSTKNSPPITTTPSTRLTAEDGARPGNLLARMWFTIAGLAALASRRLLHHPGLSILALLGIVLAVGLVTSAGFFAQAVDQVILRRELAEYSRITGRPPLATRIFVPSAEYNVLTLNKAEELGESLIGTLTAEVGIPVRELQFSLDTGVMPLLPAADDARYATGRELEKVRVLYANDIENHITASSGEPMADGQSEGILSGWMHHNLADKMGIQAGETFLLHPNKAFDPFPIKIVGFWQPTDLDDPYWLSDPNQTMLDRILVRREDYQTWVEPYLRVLGRSATWNVILDEFAMIPSRGRDYVEGFERGAIIISKYLPDARLTAPSLSLEKFVARQTTLTTLLLGFNIPAFGFLLYFLILTSAVIAYWQRRETAIFVSRGMSVSSVLNFTLMEELILFIIGCPLGLLFGVVVARFMGDTVSFLSFSGREPLPVSWHGINLSLTLFTLIVVLLARLLPAAQAARQNVISQEREHARASQAPFWYRTYLDFLLFIPTAYAYRQLADRGTLAVLVKDQPDDLFRDPLLILVPALFILTGGLVIMRFFPLLMRILDQVARLVPQTTLYLTLRQLGRQGHSYINSLLLVIVSLALGVYTLSMAASLDQWLIDRLYYNAGADVTFEPFLESEALQAFGEGASASAAWIPPKDEFGALDGVEAATRVGDYGAEIKLGGSSGQRLKGRFLAVDRVDFPEVAWFRGDFATEALGGLMNRLASSPDGILVSQEFLEANHLLIGDQIQIQVLVNYNAIVNTSFRIAGTYQYFPTVYDDEITVIGNLDHLFSFFGLTMPHNIWLRKQNGADGEAILQSVTTTGIETRQAKDTVGRIAEEQAKMERVGVFGTLTVSFLAATVMAILGLLTYSYASLQERIYHFALLNAVGLKRSQIISQVFLEYALLTLYGAAGGVFIGSLAAELFVPLFKVTGESGIPLPPLLPIIAQDEIIPLAITFAGVMIVLELVVIAFAIYQRLFKALRLGHQG